MVPGGFRALYRDEGWRGLYRGTTLALFGVSNGALQFMAYEKMKSWAFERKRRRFAELGRAWTVEDDKLVPFLFCSNMGPAFAYLKRSPIRRTQPYQARRSSARCARRIRTK